LLAFLAHPANVRVMPVADPGPETTDAVARQFRDLRGKLLAWIRRRVPDPAEAEDLLQESFLRISQRDQGTDVTHLEGYLYRTAESVLADRRRRRRVRHADAHVALEPDRHRTDDADALRTLIAKERLRKVAAALQTLPDRTRAIFVLRRIEGLRYAEIAVRLNMPVRTVEKHMARAVEHLLQNVEHEA
jgi:RNA polymerase sigma-70 factor (ECF subfamily)